MARKLMDFGTGFVSGAESGFKFSGGNPYVAGASGVGIGLLSLFGGADDRRLEGQVNQQNLALGEQNLRLGEFQLNDAMRQDRLAREREKKRKVIGQMLGEYFRGRAMPAGDGKAGGM